MAINTQKFLPSSKGGALAKVAKISKGSVAVISEKSQQNIGIIKVKVIEIDKLLKGTLASQKKSLDIKRKEGEKKKFSELETKLETKPKAEKGKIEMPKVPRMGFLDWIKNFIGNIILGYFAVRLVDQLPKLKGVISFIGKASDFVLDIGGKLLDGLVTFIDWGYKAYDATRGFMKNLFGEGGVKQFDQLSGLLNKFLNLAIIAGLAVASSGGFGGGRRGGAGTKFRPGQGGRPKVTKSGGGGQGRPDIRNPLRQRSTVTTGGSKQFRLPGSGARVTGGGGSNRLLLSQVRPFLKRIPLPVVGALVDFGLSVALGESPGRAAFRAIGAGLLGAVGAAAGTVVPVAGNFIGGLLGGMAGDAIGGVLYDMFFNGKTPTQKGKTTKSAGGGTAKGQKRRTLNTKRGKYKRKLAPRKPGQIQMQPGADVGGEDKLFGLFPNPLKAAQNAIDMMNPFKVIENTGKQLGKSDYFGPILAITSKILLGQKPSQKDYENVGLGINLLVSKGLNEGQLKGGLAAAFAEGGLVDPKALDAISQGGDITNWVAKAFKESTENNTKETLRDIQDNLALKSSETQRKDDEMDPDQPVDTQDGEGGFSTNAGDYKELLDLISSKESAGAGYNAYNEGGAGGGYQVVGYGGDSRKGPLRRALTDMTIKEIMAHQKNVNPPIHAAGRYQIIGDTLAALIRGNYGPTGVNVNDKFAPDVQDKLGIALIKYRLKTGATPENFINEWRGLKFVDRSKLQSAISKAQKGKIYATGGSMDGNIGSLPGGVSSKKMKTGPSEYIGGSTAYHIDTKFHKSLGMGNMVSAMDKLANAYSSRGRKIEFSNPGVSGEVWDSRASSEQKRSLLQRAINAHSHSTFMRSEGFLPFDYYNPKKNENRFGKSVEGSEILLPSFGGKIDVGSKYGGYGKSAEIHSGNRIVALTGHGDTRYEKGGETLGGPHLAMLGEKGREIVVDADSSGPARDMLLAINQAKDHKGVMKAIQQYAPYDAMSPQTIVMPSSGGESDYDSEMAGGGVMMMDGGGEDSYDPFDALEMGG
jgi:muramidase (phage lysozyme)